MAAALQDKHFRAPHFLERPSKIVIRNQTLDDVLGEAIRAYDYPPITYDFIQGRERVFTSMIDLEHFLKALLLSGDICRLKDGLSGIIFWGYYRVGYRDRRVKTFRDQVCDTDLRNASEIFPTLEGAGLMPLKRIGLPQFTHMAFITKLRTFLDPDHYCVLDKKIASLAPLAIRLKRQQTYIPITPHNERAYKWWVDSCSALGSRLQIKARPVDIERGFFQLVNDKHIDLAEKLLESFETSRAS
jgi:hypothetical protein